MGVLERFSLAFIPLFVAFDALGLLPMFWSLADGLTAEQRRQAVHRAALVAWLVGLVFLVVSQWIFRFLGIEIADVMCAGGAILFVLALNDLLHPEKAYGVSSDDRLGVVPLAVPLIVGPAVLTALLLLRQRYGGWLTWSAFNLNILLTWVLLLAAERLMKWVGREGAQVVSKVFNLILASFAIMLVRQGIMLAWPKATGWQ